MNYNSLIYLATTTTSSIASGGILPLSNIIRRKGCLIEQSNDSVLLKAPGYYRISITATFTAPASGVATLQVRQDGVKVQGATASTTISTATTEVRSISFDTIVRVPYCGSPSIITFINSGIDLTTSNIAVNVEYLS